MRKRADPKHQAEARQLMERFAEAAGCGLYGAGELVRVAPASWKGYATGARPLPAYIEQSLRAHLALAEISPGVFWQVVRQSE